MDKTKKGGRGFPTSHALANPENLGKSEPVPADAADNGPAALVVDGAGDYSREVGHGGQGEHGDILVVGQDHGAAVLEVKDALQLGEVPVRTVGEGQIVEEEAGLKQGVLQNLQDGVRQGAAMRGKTVRESGEGAVPYVAVGVDFLEVFARLSFARHPRHAVHALAARWSVADWRRGKGRMVHLHHACSLGAKRFTPAATAASMRFFCMVPSESKKTWTKDSSVCVPRRASTRLSLSSYLTVFQRTPGGRHVSAVS